MNSDRGDEVWAHPSGAVDQLREAEPAPSSPYKIPIDASAATYGKRVDIRPGCTRQLLTRTWTGDKQVGDRQLCCNAIRLRNLLPDDQTAQLFSSDTGRAYSWVAVLACASILSLERARRRDDDELTYRRHPSCTTGLGWTG